MIKRAYNLKELIKPGRVLVIYGSRRVGKTTLLKNFLAGTGLKYKLDKDWGKTYKDAEYLVIHKENYLNPMGSGLHLCK
jgi:AAA+ ATPase superfamily predicted ATPase